MNDNIEQVVLVNDQDQETGSAPKLQAHRTGSLHRAFSIYIFNQKGEVMLQQRAFGKYHSGGLWTNTCCGHPRPSEGTAPAAHRRLREEMGFNCDLEEISNLTYRAELDQDMIEHEFLHIFVGSSDDDPVLNPAEAEAYAWISIKTLEEELKKHPARYTEWFKICWPQCRQMMSRYSLSLRG